MSSALFSPVRFRSLELSNRIVVAPMCQYIAQDGCMHDWHLMHLGQFAVSGAGLVMTEMADVAPDGRIGPYCVGLYSDETEAAMQRVIDFCRKYSDAKLGIQLAHAGRKSSVMPPWRKREKLDVDNGGWHPVAPSPIRVFDDGPPPKELTRDEIKTLVQNFADSARRADRIGFDLIELHGAHGYLIHQFLSPVSNQRADEYGGTLENRMRFPLEVFEAVRTVWPKEKPICVKISAADWVERGWTMAETLEYCARLRDLGCDFITVSSGGIVWTEKIPTAPGFQVPFGVEIKNKVGIPVSAVGLIREPGHAEQIVASGSADLVSLARGMLWDTRWVWHAADSLGVEVAYPNQYSRARPQLAHDTFATQAASRER